MQTHCLIPHRCIDAGYGFTRARPAMLTVYPSHQYHPFRLFFIHSYFVDPSLNSTASPIALNSSLAPSSTSDCPVPAAGPQQPHQPPLPPPPHPPPLERPLAPDRSSSAWHACRPERGLCWHPDSRARAGFWWRLTRGWRRRCRL